MLDDLVQTIETLKQRVKDHRSDIENYESRTRVTLIDPLLCALGWDVSDPSIVQIEPKVKTGGGLTTPYWAATGEPSLFRRGQETSEKSGTKILPVRTQNKLRATATHGKWYDVMEQHARYAGLRRQGLAKCASDLSLWRRQHGRRFSTSLEPVVERPVKKPPASNRLHRHEPVGPMNGQPLSSNSHSTCDTRSWRLGLAANAWPTAFSRLYCY